MFVANIHRQYMSQPQLMDWRGSFEIEKHIFTKHCVNIPVSCFFRQAERLFQWPGKALKSGRRNGRSRYQPGQSITENTNIVALLNRQGFARKGHQHEIIDRKNHPPPVHQVHASEYAPVALQKEERPRPLLRAVDGEPR